MKTRKVLGAVMLSALAFGVFVAPTAAVAKGTCAGNHRGGEWPTHSGDLLNSRHQAEEKTITPARAATLAAAWQYAPPADEGATFSSTPVISGGCVYVGSQTGWVYAVNADNGKLVWKKNVEQDPQIPALGGAAGINSSLAVANGLVYASVAVGGHPYVAALEVETGDVRWATVIEKQKGAGTHSSPVVVGDLVLVGWDTAGIEFDGEARKKAAGGFAIIHARTGELLKRTYTIPEKDRKKGFSGGNIWSSFAADVAERYAYVGTAAPYSPQFEHERTNAILKVDIDRSRSTFGEIVDSYKGVPDNYSDTTGQLPCVPLVPGSNFAEGTGPCHKLDLDFAAAPNIMKTKSGKTIVGELQKAGVYHMVDAASMKLVDEVLVGSPAAGFAPTNMGTTAFDGSTIYGVGGSHNTAFGIDFKSADFTWLSKSADIPLHVNPLATANGVVYSANGSGILNAYDARTGTVLLAVEAGSGMGSGVSVARNSVFVAGSGTLTAFRPDPNRAAEVELWKSVLTSIPTPPMIPSTNKPPV